MNDQTLSATTQARTAEANAAIGTALRKTAMLATITVGVWSGSRGDKDVMDKIKSDAGATGNVGRYIKNLLSGADDKLKAAQAAYTAVRTAHYALTLPWVSNPSAERMRGPRLLPTDLFDRYATELAHNKQAALDALEVFIADYPDAIVRAKANLAALADAVYPSEAEVRRAFHVDYEFSPLPSGGDFKGLPAQTLLALGGFLENKQRAAAEGARAAVVEQVRKRVGLLAERLSDEDATFRASTVEAVRELVTLLPAWNLQGEQQIAEITSAIEIMMRATTADGMRDDKEERKHVATQAKSIVAMAEAL